ncbi:2Fe-2S iron-sulfur cluster-binding protein [Oryzicola mucosus]|uniref:(2Fe-2S)-binding protein n=1 Tax=Oryzicola mucosus TaxID=2767425 RepID=A0A8J6U084_9HYPH|nr:2Fe-2S iron-sulfur cluster-binding protein [Oryzicola mucosus]MBD0417204.1 (2Fe-2S)-binding protein [Oryzicola mucosus]
MPQVLFTLHNGTVMSVAAATGHSVMEAARNNGVPGIVAECGGAAMCATCHVYVDPKWLGKIAAMSDFEDELLEGTGSPRMETSRLSCQIPIDDGLDGLEVTVPPSQY